MESTERAPSRAAASGLSRPLSECVGVFTTPRFVVRPLMSDDEGLYQRLYCDPQTMQFIDTPLSTSEAARSFRVALRATTELGSGSAILAIRSAVAERAIGVCGVSIGVPRLDTAEVGVALESTERGKGYAREILGTLMQRVFEACDVSEIWVRYVPSQKEVVRLNRSLGFVVSGVRPTDDEIRQMAFVRRHEWKFV